MTPVPWKQDSTPSLDTMVIESRMTTDTRKFQTYVSIFLTTRLIIETILKLRMQKNLAQSSPNYYHKF